MNEKDQYVLEKLQRQLELTTDADEAERIQEQIDELEWTESKPKKKKK